MNIYQIKRYLMSKKGECVKIIYHGSRNRKERYNGILYKLYNNVFTIKLSTGEIKTFSYSDVLIKTVQLSL